MFGFGLACAGGAVVAAFVSSPTGFVFFFALATFGVGLTVSRNWNGFALTLEEEMGEAFWAR
jgi:hypothetical protein